MTARTSRTVRAGARLACIGAALVGVTTSLVTGVAHAVTVQNPAPQALVSFTFDDGFQSFHTEAAPTLAAHDLTGTAYITTDCIGMTTAPNTCGANPGLPYMTWDQVTDLQNSYGWEIGSHTVSHPCLASSASTGSPGCQEDPLTAAQVEAQMRDSKAALAAHGIEATAFAAPFGDYDNTVLTKAAKYYTSFRGFHDEGLNWWPHNDYLLVNIAVEETLDSVASLQAMVDQAIADNAWVVFTFHDIARNPDPDPSAYQYGTAELDQLAAYVQAKQAAGEIRNVNVSDGLANSDTNLLPNGGFDSGVGGGWTTDSPDVITADAAGNGSHPSPAKSIRLTSKAAGNAHLFSPVVAVDPRTTYLYKAFLNVQAVTSGSVGFYVDEYDATGAWISGQWRAYEPDAFVESMNFTYAPTSSDVTSAALQVYVEGTGVTAFLDHVRMFPLSVVTPPPPPSPANLIANGTFDAGIGDGWTTDAPTTIVADNGGSGSPRNPVTSVRLQSSTTDTHLFSPPVAVTQEAGYTVAAYLDVRDMPSGEVGFYIDEYDPSGNWISGQHMLDVQTPGVVDVTLTYEPSSAAVATASLQVIVLGDAGITAYVDDVRWWQD